MSLSCHICKMQVKEPFNPFLKCSDENCPLVYCSSISCIWKLACFMVNYKKWKPSYYPGPFAAINPSRLLIKWAKLRLNPIRCMHCLGAPQSNCFGCGFVLCGGPPNSFIQNELGKMISTLKRSNIPFVHPNSSASCILVNNQQNHMIIATDNVDIPANNLIHDNDMDQQHTYIEIPGTLDGIIEQNVSQVMNNRTESSSNVHQNAVVDTSDAAQSDHLIKGVIDSSKISNTNDVIQCFMDHHKRLLSKKHSSFSAKNKKKRVDNTSINEKNEKCSKKTKVLNEKMNFETNPPKVHTTLHPNGGSTTTGIIHFKQNLLALPLFKQNLLIPNNNNNLYEKQKQLIVDNTNNNYTEKPLNNSITNFQAI